MIIRLISAALFLLPLIGTVLVEPLIPAQKNLQSSKELLSLLFAFGISILIFLRGSQKESIVESTWPVHVLMAFLMVSAYLSPPFRLMLGAGDLGGAWIWRSMAWAFVYYFLYICTARIPLVRDEHQRMIGKAIAWAAIVSAAYACFQAVGIDQFQFVRPSDEIGTGNPGEASVNHITAMIGNPTTLGIWLSMCLPFVFLYSRKFCVLVVGAILLTRSDIAIAGLILIPGILVFVRGSMLWRRSVAILVVTLTLCAWANWPHLKPHIQDNGRFSLWRDILKEINHPPLRIDVKPEYSAAQKAEIEKLNSKAYALTGHGLGSLPFVYGQKNPWFEAAHNEYLEALYGIGILGTALLLFVLGYILRWSFESARTDPFMLACYLSFAYVCVVAAGLHVWQLEPIRFYFVLLGAMLSVNRQDHH